MTDWRLRIGLLFVGVVGVMGVIEVLGRVGVTLTDVPSFLVGAATSFILLWRLESVHLDWRARVRAFTMSLLGFILPPFVGGFIAGKPALGAVIGLIYWIPIQRYHEGTYDSMLDALFSRSIPHIIGFIGGFIGGLLRKMLF